MSNLLQKASIILTPTAYSDGDLHCIKPNTATGDFDFTRSTTATRENSSGNIESVAANLPRIDYLGGTAHILLEPQSTNTATYSNDFTQGDIFNGSADPSVDAGILTSQQATSPDGTNNAWLLKDDNSGGNGQPNLRFYATSLTSNDFNTVSIFAKKSLTNDFIVLSSAGFDISANGDSWFNISNGSLESTSANHTAKIEDYGDGWYRCSITFQTTTDTQGAVRIRLAVTDGSVSVPLDGTNGSYIFGLQCEASASQNFPTSYIPTSGSTVTRNADEANNSGSSDLINSTEGVLYAEIAALADDLTFRTISLSNGTNDECVRLRFLNSSNKINGLIRDEGSAAANITFTVTDVRDFHKAAYKYKSGNCELWVDGVKRGTSTNTFSLSTQTQLNFNQGTASDIFYGKVKCVAVFKEALTDAELQCLTS